MDIRRISGKTIGKHIVVLALAFHLLNFSIDSRDPTTAGLNDDLSLTEIESITELVLEDFLDVGNVISDTDEADGEGETLNAPLKVLFCNGVSDLTPPYEGCPAEPRRAGNTITLYSFDSEVTGPPPRNPSS